MTATAKIRGNRRNKRRFDAPQVPADLSPSAFRTGPIIYGRSQPIKPPVPSELLEQFFGEEPSPDELMPLNEFFTWMDELDRVNGPGGQVEADTSYFAEGETAGREDREQTAQAS